MTITPQHAAPEVFATFVHVADFSVSTAADMWSLACLLYELCTGCSLFDGKGSATIDASQLHATSSSDPPSSSADQPMQPLWGAALSPSQPLQPMLCTATRVIQHAASLRQPFQSGTLPAAVAAVTQT